MVAGISLGGIPALSIASGNSFISNDSRVKALILLDIVTGSNQSDYELAGSPFNVTVPSLIFHLAINGDANKLMKRSAGVPQISIFQKKVHHFSTVDYCPIIDGCREAALAKGLPDPLLITTNDLNSIIVNSLWPKIGEYYCDTSVWQTPVPSYLIPNRDNYTPEQENFRRVTLFMVSFLKTYVSGDPAYASFLTPNYVKTNFDKGDLTLEIAK